MTMADPIIRPPLRPVHVEGTSFVNDLGQKQTYCGFNVFPLLERFIHGQDITPILTQIDNILGEVRRQAAVTGDGAWVMPVLRVAGMGEKADNQVMSLYPQREPTFYTSVRALADFVAGKNGDPWRFYLDLDVFINAQLVMPDQEQRLRHWWNVGQAFVGCQTVFQAVGSELFKNGIPDPDVFPAPPTGVLWSRGSQGSGMSPPVQHGASYAKYHTKRGGTKGLLGSTDALYAKIGFTAETASGESYPGNPGPVIVEETANAYEQTVGDSQLADPSYFFWHGVYSSRTGGGTFHSTAGQHGELYGPITEVCCLAFCMGCAKIDPAQRYP